MKFLRTIYLWAMIVVMTSIVYSMILCSCVWVALSGRKEHHDLFHRYATLWGQLAIRFMPGWHFKVSGLENIDPSQHYVIVANHQSMADIWAIYFLNVQFRWLSKKEVFKIPVIGHAMKLAGYLSVDRGSATGRKKAYDQAEAVVQRGTSMFFFPEGTRSPDGTIRDFKIGAFRLARDHGVPILPVALHGADKLLVKGSFVPGKATVRISVLPPLPPPRTDESELHPLAAQVRDLIVTEYSKLLAEEGSDS